MKKSIIIDTDPGVDDALAIMFAQHSSELDICGLTTVFGNQTVDKTTLNTCAVVDMLNAKIPVYQGSSRPLYKDPLLAQSHGDSGLGGYKQTGRLLSGTHSSIPQQLDAVRFMAETIVPGMHIACLGPLTNIAMLANLYPEALRQVESLIIMGGVIDAKGNVSPWAEFNVFNDPDAWQQVLAFEGIRKIVVPADVCRSVQMIEQDFTNVKDAALSQAIGDVIREYVEYYREDHDFGGFRGGVMYDSLVTAYLLWPELFYTKPCHIVVDTSNGQTRGATFVDSHMDGHPNCLLVTRNSDGLPQGVDAAEVKRRLLALLS